MPDTTRPMLRRVLLASGGSLLAGGVAGKPPPDAQAASLLPKPPLPVPPLPVPMQPITALRLEAPVPLPKLRFADAQGQPRSIAEYSGRGVVLNFWATWCTPCVTEMPSLDRLARLLRQSRLGSQAGVVLAVSEDRAGAAAVRRFYAARAITALPVLLDPHMQAMQALRLDAIPTTLLIDPNGRAVATVQGPVRWDTPQAAELVSRLLRR